MPPSCSHRGPSSRGLIEGAVAAALGTSAVVRQQQHERVVGQVALIYVVKETAEVVVGLKSYAAMNPKWVPLLGQILAVE